MLLPRLSPIPSLIFSGSVFVASSLPDPSLLLFSQSVVPKSFPVLAASFQFSPASSLLLAYTSVVHRLSSWPFPDPAGTFPVLSCLAASAASGRLGLSLFSPASSLLHHGSSGFPHCSAFPLCFSLLLTWSLPVLPMVLQWSFPSLAGSLPVRPCFLPALYTYCHFFLLLCFMVIALLPCSFQVLLTPCLVKSC